MKRLEAEGKISRISVDPVTVRDAMNLAERDLAVAKEVLTINDDWASNISYNAMLQAGRALMFSKGYRPRGSEPHLAVRDFLRNSSTIRISRTSIAYEERDMLQHTTM